ncbi:MAG: TetR/AcrR family transcriptional regulator [Acidimicrobiales bacterium]
MAEPGGRIAQRRRTRNAIVEATQQLLRAGGQPSVAEIASLADVSRRTVYLHFPSLEQLVLDATLGEMAAGGWDYTPDEHGSEVGGRVRGLAATLLAMSSEALPLGRRIIRLTVERPDRPDPAAPRRGYRRIDWIEQAVEPLRAELSDEQFDRLVSGLAVVLGWEAMVVLRDIRSLSAAAEAEVTTWVAQALVDAMLAEVHRTAGDSGEGR